ncbi:NAD(P)H dehydrogenase (quinone) [Candidatus Hydrogenisulfobacillus filiaventi]|uniref:NAD(P)H dehydrogenase (Quinone) n=1 Tax=Candidatus Hydrogenisulfobacillus filiaventi TaxID=2707344 RepID=A0A6F8ZHR3_9FIRM|nr:NAD(P)H:quinone oxidoreductase [Bacillota bacterium]CAB1129326.1 NAD(P)H dehydrogenase (quinone) [Candidatus Hydrogenisulfobacillus filiaventi]
MRIAIIYYSMTGNLYDLAQEVEAGAREAGAETRLRRVRDWLPEEVYQARPEAAQARERQQGVVEAELDDLVWADGVILGTPTRYGNVVAQLKNFLDQTGPLWAEGKLVDKTLGFFTAAATMHGGHETTVLTLSTFGYHHGMIIVPMGYTVPEVNTTTTGGGPYGPTHVGGPGLSAEERTIARAYGRRFAAITGRLHG